MKKYVLYHSSCADGFGAAFAAWLKFGDEAVYIPVQYNRPPPMMEEPDEVYIVDFSYPAETLLEMARQFSKVVVLDHHATAKADLTRDKFETATPFDGLDFANDISPETFRRGRIQITFDMNKSGAVLAWEYFHPGKPVPEFFRYLQDRDLWQWKMPMSREVSDAIRSYPFDFKVWNDICGFGTSTDSINPIERLWQEGVGIRRMTRQTVCVAAANARFAIFQKGKEGQYPPQINFQDNLDGLGEDYSVYWASPVLNCTAFISETCEQMLAIHPKAKFVASYFDAKDGKRIWSLRSRPDYDCSVIAKHFEGGGHKNSAGFTQQL